MRINTFPTISFKRSNSNYNIIEKNKKQIDINANYDISKKESKLSLYNDYNILAPKSKQAFHTLHQFPSEKTPQEGQFMGDNGKVFNRHTTHYARVDLNWKDLGDFLENRFQKAEKVNTYIYGCSYGEEVYTLLSLLSLRTKNPKKFFPIKAKDITPEIIENNIERQKNGVTLSLDEISKICKGIGVSEKESFPILTTTKDNKIKIKNNCAKQVEFECANILLDIESIDTENPSIIMARNMWPYISPEKYEAYAQDLYKKLAPNSVVIIGNFDNIGEGALPETKKFPHYLKKSGFKPTKNVMGILPSINEKPIVFVKE